VSDWINEELLRDLNSEVAEGLVKVEAEGPWPRWVEARFPIGFNRIDWSAVPEKQTADVPILAGEPDAQRQATLARFEGQLATWFEGVGLAPSQLVVWIGDDTEFALEMTIATLLSCFPRLFSFPQHSYVLVVGDRDWCLNYAMEGYLVFAAASTQRGQP